MEQVARCTDALIMAIRQSEDYRRYLEAEHEVHKDPELKKRIDGYRLRVFELQGEASDIYEQSDVLLQEFASLHRNSVAAEYLEAESAFCRLLRLTLERISAGIPVELPQRED